MKPGGKTMEKRRNWRLVVSTLLLASCLAATACSSSTNGTGNVGATNVASETNKASAGKKESTGDKIDPLGKYDPPINVSVATLIDQATKFRDGESIENNNWMTAYREQLGIKVNYNWTVTGTIEQYNQKLNITIASNELPDFVTVNAMQMKQMAESGQLAELNEVYEKYASPLSKSIFEYDATALNSAKIDGKLMGLPFVSALPDNAPMLFIRTDWLKALGLPEPKTMDDLFAIMDAFTNRDPDGNQRKDTYGLALTKGLYEMPGLKGFFNAYHAYPTLWVKDDAGKTVYGEVMPQMKAALAKLQALYKSGQIDPEFGVKDAGKLYEEIAMGKFGVFFGLDWAPIVIKAGKISNPKMEWKAFPLPSIDGKVAKASTPFNVSQYVVARKGAKNPEAVMKMMNLSVEKLFGESAEPEVYSTGKDGIAIHKYRLFQLEHPLKNLNQSLHIQAALAGSNPSALNAAEKLTYQRILDYQAGDLSQWSTERVFGIGGAFSILDEYTKNNRLLLSEYVGTSTPTMVDKKATLDKMEQEVFTKIIMGTSTMDEFDKYVDNWHRLGGSKITEEVNKALSKSR
ncbi:extracellular solute-binding protein [Paenibacillus sp. LMG 31458]|uniref:Extracellular solute-binding protein n=2 Tax=Paenibacillus phytorum TaxID=2654977 RepID=A0ABX1Y5V8_9BACL|nr:extracellular solute-binding protein [Paenibacillus phytorum]